MPGLKLCRNDPIIGTLRDVFGANVVRVPESRIQPTCVVAHRGGSTSFRGALEHLFPAGDEWSPRPGDIEKSRMPNLAGRRSRAVDVGLGLSIMSGFLRGFGANSTSLEASFQGVREVAFSFDDVERRYIDVNRLGKQLSGRAIDRANPAAAIFLDGYDFLVIDSVIGSRDFQITVTDTNDAGFQFAIPAVQQLIGHASGGLSVTSATGRDLRFCGTEHLSFAFTCVRFQLQPDGRIAHLLPHRDGGIELESIHPSHGQEADAVRVLLSEDPVLLDL